MARSWIFDWLEENGVTTQEKASTVFSDRPLFGKFRLAAQQIISANLNESDDRKGVSILAGRGMDLTGDLECTSGRCLVKQVDTLLRHVWHYFDYIYVTDFTKTIAQTPLKKINTPYASGWLRAVIYLLEIGASDMVVFAKKDGVCEKCVARKAEIVGLGSLLSAPEEFIDKLTHESTLAFGGKKGAYQRVGLEFPGLDGAWVENRAITWIKSKSTDQMMHDLASSYATRVVHGLIDDTYSARRASVSLGATVKHYKGLISRAQLPAQFSLADQIALRIEVPVLENVPLASILALKKHEGDVFQNFQAKLRIAIREKARTVNDCDAEKAAKDIMDDIIAPQVAEIRSILSRNSRSLQRTFTSVVVGAAAMTAGLMLNNPAIASVGGIAASAGLTNMFRGLQDRDTVENRDMYFLFKAAEHADAHPERDDAGQVPWRSVHHD